LSGGVLHRVRIFFMIHANEPIETTELTFDGLSISQNIIDILRRLNFTKPTPIQAKTIPLGIAGADIVGIAQTGTGKTLAFGIPMIQKLTADNTSMGLILVPTRELAMQVHETLNRVAAPMRFGTALLIGGESMTRQIRDLRARPRIIIATPGRLNDLIKQRIAKLDTVKIFILDEADRMLDMGFAPQITEIAKHVPTDRQTLLFSATMPHSLTHLAHSFMKNPKRVDVAPQGSPAALVTHELFAMQKPQKLPLLLHLLKEYSGSVLVFSRTKYGAKHIAEALRNQGIASAEIHSNRSQAQRKMALEGFKSGKFRVLVATDIAARGIHVSGIELVINFDLPEQAEDYVHRIGRTGRAGKSGHAISFATFDQKMIVRNIERLINKHLPLTPLPALQPYSPAPMRKFSPVTHARPATHARPSANARPSMHSNAPTSRPHKPAAQALKAPYASKPHHPGDFPKKRPPYQGNRNRFTTSREIK